MKTIYTFWHDKNSMPEYIKICIESWRKHLPDFEIIILNYDNLESYIGKNFYDKVLFEEFTIAQQTQAIRAAVLEQNGGYWFDADIIVTSNKFLEFFDEKSELNIFTNRIACMRAKKGSKILKKWIKGIKRNIWFYKHFFEFMFRYFPDTASDMMQWDYLSDKILNKLYKCKNKTLLNNIDIMKSNVYPEISWNKESRRKEQFTPVDLYNYFYIKNDFSEYVFSKNQGLIILHNSWMPRNYQNIDLKELLSQHNTISEIMRELGL